MSTFYIQTCYKKETTWLMKGSRSNNFWFAEEHRRYRAVREAYQFFSGKKAKKIEHKAFMVFPIHVITTGLVSREWLVGIKHTLASSL